MISNNFISSSTGTFPVLGVSSRCDIHNSAASIVAYIAVSLCNINSTNSRACNKFEHLEKHVKDLFINYWVIGIAQCGVQWLWTRQQQQQQIITLPEPLAEQDKPGRNVWVSGIPDCVSGRNFLQAFIPATGHNSTYSQTGELINVNKSYPVIAYGFFVL